MRCKVKTTRLNSRGFIFIQQSAKLEAGLPNIAGGSTATYNLGKSFSTWDNTNKWSGALNITTKPQFRSSMPSAATEENAWIDCTLEFDASKSNPIYGNSNTVQPPAIQLIPQIKY